jgi:hypothetical protein
MGEIQDKFNNGANKKFPLGKIVLPRGSWLTVRLATVNMSVSQASS